ncbi:hypothetical protein OG271_09910 [Micromonospora rifamycinica]|uniref:hypothetical protein n=1 Tax=Micromonospora rifamycinica TaxID=291594 RepID=UPI002E2B9EBA|nr:hypothetical protein [Micromonospora rifamycinica]
MSDIVEIARLVRPYLDRLVAAHEVDGWQRRLGALLAAAAAGEQVDDRLRALFLQDPVVRAWVAETLGDPELRPPEVVRVLSMLADAPPGDPIGSRLQRYACPVNRCTLWDRLSPAEVVPRCHDHHELMVEIRRS